MLGHDQPREITVERLLDGVDTHAGLVRVAGAVALGLAENGMYWSAGSPQCRDYLALLTGSGLDARRLDRGGPRPQRRPRRLRRRAHRHRRPRRRATKPTTRTTDDEDGDDLDG